MDTRYKARQRQIRYIINRDFQRLSRLISLPESSYRLQQQRELLKEIRTLERESIRMQLSRVKKEQRARDGIFLEKEHREELRLLKQKIQEYVQRFTTDIPILTEDEKEGQLKLNTYEQRNIQMLSDVSNTLAQISDLEKALRKLTLKNMDRLYKAPKTVLHELVHPPENKKTSANTDIRSIGFDSEFAPLPKTMEDQFQEALKIKQQKIESQQEQPTEPITDKELETLNTDMSLDWLKGA